MDQFHDAFISYGRADSKAFAKKLNDHLIAQNLDIWFDFEDIPLGVDYQKQIDDGIEKADNFIFIIAPHSINSPYCRLEIELAVKHRKRIIPIFHVEKISREIWQQRFPNSTDADWDDYRKKGLHSSYPNMHTEIAKINWIFCQENVDDFQQALQNLSELIDRDRTYVRQHTYFLCKALKWDRTHRETRWLLEGEDHQQAENWLKFRFKDSQPPCVPTELHCEYITASIKNANNLMTQAFLSWADEDRTLMELIRLDLMREGFTVWSSSDDIETGSDFQRAIMRGIEEADNLIYLISPDSLASQYCQQELEYALSLNKRIIPLLIRPVTIDTIPPQLQSLQFINFIDKSDQESCAQDISKLIKIINQDADYYEKHKILLCAALKWQRQNYNPCILLRGYNLNHAEAWLEVGKYREQHQPTALIEQFIQDSLRQPPGIALDIFISYSRQDAGLARRLNDALQLHNKKTWFDQESIAAGSVDFQQEIYRGIESSDHFLFVISPKSITSPYCTEEVNYAVKLNKRIITLLANPVDPLKLPVALASVQWLDFSQSDNNFEISFSSLLRILETDPDYLKTHTWLLMRALEWEHKGFDEGLLLSGNVLQEIRQWFLDNKDKKPEPTRLQRDYVTASSDTEMKRHRMIVRWQRVGLVFALSISTVALFSAWTAWHQYKEAKRLEHLATQKAILAETNASDSLFQSGQTFEALKKAMDAAIKLKQNRMNDPMINQPVLTALQQAVFWVQERQQLGPHEGIIWSVSVSSDGRYIASAGGDGHVKIWQRNGRLVQQISSPDGGSIFAVAFAPDGESLVMAGARNQGTKGEVSLVHWRDARRISFGLFDAPVVTVAVSPDGQTIATGGEDSLVRLWTRKGKLIKTLAGHASAVRSVTFSPDGQAIASASDDRTIRLWRRDGTLIKTLIGHTAQVRSVAYSPDGQQLVSASWDETVRLWRRDGTPIKVIEGHNGLVNDARFSPNGKVIASAGWDKNIYVWTNTGTKMFIRPGHTAQIRTLAFDPKDNSLISAGGDHVVRIWTLKLPLLTVLQTHWARVYSVTFSKHNLLATTGADKTIRLWTTAGKLLHVLKGHQSVVWDASFSPDGQTLASASSDYTIKLWHVATGRLIKTLTGHAGPVYSVQYSADGQLLVSTGADQTVRLWRRDGTPIRTLQDFKRGLLSVAISPDNRLLAVSGWSNTVHLLTLDGKLVKNLNGHQGWVYYTLFSPDGQRLLTASYDGTAKVWDRRGKLLATLRGHEDGIDRADFSADGHLIATASQDGTAKLWTLDGKLITTLRGHRDRVTDVAFSPNGQFLATSSEDGKALIWQLNIQGNLNKLLEKGCAWMHDYLQFSQNLDEEMLESVRQYCLQPSVSSPNRVPNQ